MLKRQYLAEPLEWGTEMISVVFILALANDIQGLTRHVVGEIATISENQTVVQQLIEAAEAEEVMKILSN